MNEKVTLQNFKETVINSKKPVLVKFYSPWCSACQTLNKVTDGIQKDIGDRALFKEVDIEEEKELSKLLKIMNVPTIVIFNKGRITNHHVGLITKQELLRLIP